MNIWRSKDQIVEASAPSGATVVSVDAMKVQARIDNNDENALLASLAAAAESHVERVIQRYLRLRTVTLRLGCLPLGRVPVALPGGIVSAITSVVIDGEDFAGCVALGDSPARLVPPSDWPRPVGEGYPVVITYTAGFSTVPEDLMAAIKMIAGEMYERREVGSMESVGVVPVNAHLLMQPYRIWALA
jgi:uncharacterized phiE125 gp8 family phage protein